jgi:hypothetical protein
MVHTFTESMSDVGSGVGGLFSGMTPLATFPIYMGVADMTSGVMKGVGKKMDKKVKKQKKKMKAKKKK